jgi:hypothetical protein
MKNSRSPKHRRCDALEHLKVALTRIQRIVQRQERAATHPEVFVRSPARHLRHQLRLARYHPTDDLRRQPIHVRPRIRAAHERDQPTHVRRLQGFHAQLEDREAKAFVRAHSRRTAGTVAPKNLSLLFR